MIKNKYRLAFKYSDHYQEIMFNRILKESLHEVVEHPDLVRIAFLTWFVHTLASFWRFGYTFYIILEKNVDVSRIEWTLWEYIRAIFDIAAKNMSVWTIIFLVILLIIWYVFLYPIGHGMMVSYIQDHSGTKAIKESLGRYFTITITEWLLGAVTFWWFHLMALRYFYQWGILNNILVQIIVFLIGSFVLICTFLYAYANISAVTDTFGTKKPTDQAREALQNSSNIATTHIWTTIKFMFLSILLEVRFFVMTAIVIAIPAFLVRVALQLGLIGESGAVVAVMISVWLFLVASIYINSIIDAFFTVYRYKLYIELSKKK